MLEFEIKFLVEKPIDQVFSLISDIPNYRRWVPDQSGFFLSNEITSEGPIGLGTTYLDRLRWRGKAVGKIVKYQPPSTIRFEQRMIFGLPVFSATIDYEMRPEQNFTEVTHKFTAVVYGLFKLFGPLLYRVVRAERKRTCEAIKQALKTKSTNPDAVTFSD